MKDKQKQTIESILHTNINEQVHAVVKEFSMACKKAAIYGSTHPLSKKAIQKPFLLFDKIFRYKKIYKFQSA